MPTPDRSLRHRPFVVTFTGLAAALLAIGCGGGDESTSGSPSAPAASTPAAPAKSVTEQVQTLTADGRKCIELVKARSWVESIDVCERAAKDSANLASTEFSDAYAAAEDEAKKAAQKAAVKAGSDMLEGKSADEAAKGALDDATGGFGKPKS